MKNCIARYEIVSLAARGNGGATRSLVVRRLRHAPTAMRHGTGASHRLQREPTAARAGAGSYAEYAAR